jgi:hypothetical protein
MLSFDSETVAFPEKRLREFFCDEFDEFMLAGKTHAMRDRFIVSVFEV